MTTCTTRRNGWVWCWTDGSIITLSRPVPVPWRALRAAFSGFGCAACVAGRRGMLSRGSASRVCERATGPESPSATRGRANGLPSVFSWTPPQGGAGCPSGHVRICAGGTGQPVSLPRLKAGILEEGTLKRTDTGTPQGGVISPTISNIFLHTVLDRWYEDEVQPRLWGASQLVRYADDLVMTFEHDRDARRVLAVLSKRLGRYGLTLHETKTRYVDFRPPRGKGRGRYASFDFLGFTHTWGTSRKGNKVMRQVTAKARFARAVKSVHEWCKANRHRPLTEQHAHLARVIRGHCAYYGLTGNSKRLNWFRWQVERSWRKALSRRSRDGELSWARMDAVFRRFPLPPARVMRSIYIT